MFSPQKQIRPETEKNSPQTDQAAARSSDGSFKSAKSNSSEPTNDNEKDDETAPEKSVDTNIDKPISDASTTITGNTADSSRPGLRPKSRFDFKRYSNHGEKVKK